MNKELIHKLITSNLKEDIDIGMTVLLGNSTRDQVVEFFKEYGHYIGYYVQDWEYAIDITPSRSSLRYRSEDTGIIIMSSIYLYNKDKFPPENMFNPVFTVDKIPEK